MASRFFVVHHQLEPGKAAARCDTAMSAMADDAAWSASVAADLHAGFFKRSLYPTAPDGPTSMCGEPAKDLHLSSFKIVSMGLLGLTSE